jgi:hypothetical protein
LHSEQAKGEIRGDSLAAAKDEWAVAQCPRGDRVNDVGMTHPSSARRAARANKATLSLQLIVTTEDWQKVHEPLAAVARRAKSRINYQPSTLASSRIRLPPANG